MQSQGKQNQKDLPFIEAECSYDERLNYLGLALMRIEANIYICNLSRWIFNVTKGGIDGALEKTLTQLAARPWGLCCSIATVQRAIRESREIIQVEQQNYRNGTQRPNLYTIDWDAVGDILRLKISRPNHPKAVGHCDQGDSQSDHHPSHTDQGGSQSDQRYKEELSYGPSNCPSF